MSGSSVWECPGCGRKFRLPEGKKPPRQCQTCVQAAQQLVPAPVIDESSFLADLAASAPSPAPMPPVPPPAPERALPATFVKVIDPPDPKSLAFRAGKFLRRQSPIAAALAVIGLIGASIVGAMLITSVIHVWAPAQKESTVAFKPLTDDQVFLLATREVRDRLKAQKTAEFSNEYQFKPIHTKPGEPEQAWIIGEVDAQNAFGTFIHSEWTMSVTIDREAWTIVPSVITLGGETIYQDEATAEAFRGFERAVGNEMSGLSPLVEQEIHQIEVAAMREISTAVRDRGHLLKWPNDPTKPGLRINLDLTKTWRVSGLIDMLDGGSPREVYGHFEPDTNSCIRLRIGKKWYVGSPPPDINGFPVN